MFDSLSYKAFLIHVIYGGWKFYLICLLYAGKSVNTFTNTHRLPVSKDSFYFEWNCVGIKKCVYQHIYTYRAWKCCNICKLRVLLTSIGPTHMYWTFLLSEWIWNTLNKRLHDYWLYEGNLLNYAQCCTCNYKQHSLDKGPHTKIDLIDKDELCCRKKYINVIYKNSLQTI